MTARDRHTLHWRTHRASLEASTASASLGAVLAFLALLAGIVAVVAGFALAEHDQLVRWGMAR